MSGFLILDPRPVYFTQTGDPTLSYRVQLYDANGALQFDQDNVSGGGGGGAGGSIPALLTGKFLTNDGSQLLWADIRQLPDPTGQSGKVLSTDGANFTWIAKPADGAAGAAGTNAAVTVTPSSVKWSGGTGDLFYIQSGSGSAPAGGIPSTSVAITFPVPFKTLIGVFPITTGNSYATAGKLGIPAITAKTTTGFTVAFDTNTTTDNIFASVPFDWIALGTIGA
jgi:hypothetical protein